MRDRLNQIATESTGLSALRMYWYDAAPYDRPTAHHSEIAKLANVKLRLGRIKSGRQKGVDALIYHDLVNLARERAISDLFLVSGDEDLREGVRTVQGMGVRVTLVGIPPSYSRTNQSLELVQEADEVLSLTKDELSGFLRLRSQRGSLTAQESREPVPSTATSTDPEIARAAAASLAEKVKGSPEVTEILSSYPRIPPEVDRELLRSLRRDLKTHEVRNTLRHEARTSFWKTLRATDRPSIR